MHVQYHDGLDDDDEPWYFLMSSRSRACPKANPSLASDCLGAGFGVDRFASDSRVLLNAGLLGDVATGGGESSALLVEVSSTMGLMRAAGTRGFGVVSAGLASDAVDDKCGAACEDVTAACPTRLGGLTSTGGRADRFTSTGGFAVTGFVTRTTLDCAPCTAPDAQSAATAVTLPPRPPRAERMSYLTSGSRRGTGGRCDGG